MLNLMPFPAGPVVLKSYSHGQRKYPSTTREHYEEALLRAAEEKPEIWAKK